MINQCACSFNQISTFIYRNTIHYVWRIRKELDKIVNVLVKLAIKNTNSFFLTKNNYLINTIKYFACRRVTHFFHIELVFLNIRDFGYPELQSHSPLC